MASIAATRRWQKLPHNNRQMNAFTPTTILRILRSSRSLSVGLALCIAVGPWAQHAASEEVLPKHITTETLKAVRSGLDYLARTQADDGSWRDASEGGQAYPVSVSALACTALLANGNSPTRGRYAEQLQRGTEYLLKCAAGNKSGLITGPEQERGQPMHGHGFALMYLASVYGMESKESRRKAISDAVAGGVSLTARGQSGAGGWSYVPGQGDEGSVTVTQVQALRAAQNAGFDVPAGTIQEAVRYLERCSTPEGGICYSLGSGGEARLPISAAAVATLYNAGEYDSPLANRCLDFVWQRFEDRKQWVTNQGHDFYTHLYASQAFYMAGDKYWDKYFPATRDQLLKMQDKAEGSWSGDGIGKTYGTAIALIILQLPYKFLPVYQR
jgi:Prenyltransferase and squalene oxidase repeat